MGEWNIAQRVEKGFRQGGGTFEERESGDLIRWVHQIVAPVGGVTMHYIALFPFSGLTISSNSSSPTSTSRGFDPFAGPNTPASSS